MEALFAQDGEIYAPTDYARGPWTPEFLDGGAIGALVGHVAEQARPDGLQLARATIDLLAPVPAAPLRVASTLVHAGRRFEMRDVTVHAPDGTLVSRASVLNVAQSDTPPFAMPQTVEPPVPPPDVVPEFKIPSATTNFQSAVELRMYRVMTLEETLGGWGRLRTQVVGGFDVTPTVSAMAMADRANAAVSLSPDMSAAAINADISVLLAREPSGEWIGIDGQFRFQGAGRGAGSVYLRDGAGAFGMVAVSLLPPRFDFAMSADLSAALEAHDGGESRS